VFALGDTPEPRRATVSQLFAASYRPAIGLTKVRAADADPGPTADILHKQRVAAQRPGIVW
jgi:hypothetical protein